MSLLQFLLVALAGRLAVQEADAWTHDRKRGFFGYPARVYAGANVAVMSEMFIGGGKADTPKREERMVHALKGFLFAGGAYIDSLRPCSGQRKTLTRKDVIFSVHFNLKLESDFKLHSKEWVSAALEHCVPCLSPSVHESVVLLVDGVLLGVYGGELFSEKFSPSAMESVYEIIMSNANNISFQKMPPRGAALVPLPAIVEKAQVVIKDRLYSFGGFYETFNAMFYKVVIYDLSRGNVEVIKEFDLPAEFPAGTQAYAGDGERFIYVAGGQTLPGCSYGSRIVFRFDTVTESFLRLPDLPFHVQSGQLVFLASSNSLHFTGGSFNRSMIFPYSPHYILQLPSDKSSADTWLTGSPHWKWTEGARLTDSPRLHHIAVALKDGFGREALYVIGGVEEDAGYNPNITVGSVAACGVTESGEPDLRSVYKYIPIAGGSWERQPDLPMAFSHADPSALTVANGRGILVFGGQTSLFMNKGYPRKGLVYVMSTMRHITFYVPSLNISRTVGYLPQWFRGEGVKALVALRQRVPVPGKGTKSGAILLFGGEKSDTKLPPRPSPPFISEDMARVTLSLFDNAGNLLESIE